MSNPLAIVAKPNRQKGKEAINSLSDPLYDLTEKQASHSLLLFAHAPQVYFPKTPN